jgi:hypothetical protein
VLLHVAKTLGQDSPVLREATKIAVQQLAEVDFVKIEDHTLTVNSDRIAALSQQALKLERSKENGLNVDSPSKRRRCK